MTQKELALAAGVSKDLIYKWERGFHGATPRTTGLVAGVLGVQAQYLIGYRQTAGASAVREALGATGRDRSRAGGIEAQTH